jgi:hypothetical protein
MSNPATQPGGIRKFLIYSSSSGEPIDLSGVVSELSYYENVLSNTITASVAIVESGTEKLQGKTVLDGLPIRGGERIDLIFQDSQEQENLLSFLGKDKALYVNRVKNLDSSPQKSVYTLDLCTREFISNEQSRVLKRYDGKISDHIQKILTENYNAGIKISKKIDIDETVGNYNFVGNTRKPFYVCTWLATKAIPKLDKNKATGAAGGYFFYETFEGFKFKSIDVLLQQDPKKYYLYSNHSSTVETTVENSPQGSKDAKYEKILSVDIERNMDLQQNMLMGTYNNRSIFFNFYSFDYEVQPYQITEQQNRIQTAGKNFVFVPEEFRNSPTRIMSHILDLGALPSGKNAEEQLKTWNSNPTTPNFDAKNIMVQSIMRYNQLFSIKLNVMIAGDFSLRAGDIIYCDFPEINNTKLETNKETGGKYLIASLCHKVTPKNTYTSLTLVRDSFGKQTR